MLAIFIRSAVILAGLSWALTLGACATPSLHPIYTADDKPVLEPGLVGTWKKSDGKDTYTVTRAGDGYHLLVKDNKPKEARQWEFSVRLVKLGDTNFADFSAPENDSAAIGEKWGPLFVPTHLFAAWTLDKDALTVRILDEDWLKDGVANKKVTLALTHVDDEILITAETKDLQAFLKEHAKDERAFGDGMKLERVK